MRPSLLLGCACYVCAGYLCACIPRLLEGSLSRFLCRSGRLKGPPYLMVDLCLIARLFEGFLPVGESSPPDPPPGRFQRPKSAPSIAHRWALACLRRRAPPWTSWGAGICWLARWLLCSRCAGAPASATCKVPQHGALRGVLLLNQEQLLVSSRLPLRWPFSGLWIDVPPALSGSAMS